MSETNNSDHPGGKDISHWRATLIGRRLVSNGNLVALSWIRKNTTYQRERLRQAQQLAVSDHDISTERARLEEVEDIERRADQIPAANDDVDVKDLPKGWVMEGSCTEDRYDPRRLVVDIDDKTGVIVGVWNA